MHRLIRASESRACSAYWRRMVAEGRITHWPTGMRLGRGEVRFGTPSNPSTECKGSRRWTPADAVDLEDMIDTCKPHRVARLSAMLSGIDPAQSAAMGVLG